MLNLQTFIVLFYYVVWQFLSYYYYVIRINL